MFDDRFRSIVFYKKTRPYASNRYQLYNFLGSQSNRSSVNSLLSVSSLTGRSTYNISKQSSLDKFESFRKSSMDISSSSAKNVKNFITGMVTPRLTRKNKHSASSDTLTSESTENLSQVDYLMNFIL